MVMYILSTTVSAMEKERATLLLKDMIDNHLCDNVDMAVLLASLLKVFNQKKPTARCR